MPTVPSTGAANCHSVLRFVDASATPATTATTAAPAANMRKSCKSARRLGSITTMVAPIIGPVRVLRPPMITARRNITVSSKL